MNISNHAATGAIIAMSIDKPIIGIPLALASHIVLDYIPHFGYKESGGIQESLKHRLTYLVIGVDIILLTLLAVLLRDQSFYVFFAAIVAQSPDFIWLYYYLVNDRKGKETKLTWFDRLHANVQWCERPWGIVIEYSFFTLLVTIILKTI